MTATLTTTRCRTCGSDDVRVLRHSDAYGFDVGRCKRCRMVWVLNAPEADQVEERYVGGTDCTPYVELHRAEDPGRDAVLEHLLRLAPHAPGQRPLLFDVGAGVGEFLLDARAAGFDVAGNEISPKAIETARELHGVELSPLMIGDQPAESADVLTMWCVLAHVPDPAQFVREAFAMLRPGGILFIRTPRWCTIDRVGFGAARATGGRWTKVADRRITPAHLHLFHDRALRTLLSDAGFVDVDLQPSCHYPFATEAYLGAVLPAPVATRAARGVDRLIDERRFIRNANFAFARRPA